MVLRGQLRGRVGSRRDYLKSSREKSRELFRFQLNRHCSRFRCRAADLRMVLNLLRTAGSGDPELGIHRLPTAV